MNPEKPSPARSARRRLIDKGDPRNDYHSLGGKVGWGCWGWVGGWGVKGRCQSLVCLTRAIADGGLHGQFLCNLDYGQISLDRYHVRKYHAKDIFIKIGGCRSDSRPAGSIHIPLTGDNKEPRELYCRMQFGPPLVHGTAREGGHLITMRGGRGEGARGGRGGDQL